MSSLKAQLKQAKDKAKKDWESNLPPNCNPNHEEKAKIAYYSVYYTLRTNKRLAHIVEKYGPIV